MAKYKERGMKSHRAPKKRSGLAVQCPLGLVPYPTKQAAELASGGASVERCGRCRQWHPVGRKGKGR